MTHWRWQYSFPEIVNIPHSTLECLILLLSLSYISVFHVVINKQWTIGISQFSNVSKINNLYTLWTSYHNDNSDAYLSDKLSFYAFYEYIVIQLQFL